jgi:hypothetical protein
LHLGPTPKACCAAILLGKTQLVNTVNPRKASTYQQLAEQDLIYIATKNKNKAARCILTKLICILFAKHLFLRNKIIKLQNA